jgi:hypothetical protein
MKKVLVVIVGSVSVPEDWDMSKIKYHLRHGAIELGDVADDVRNSTGVLVYHDVTEALVINDKGEVA